MKSLKFGHRKLYVGGEERDSSSGSTFEVICPATEEAIATISWASKQDTLDSLAAAQEGFNFWSVLPVEQRLVWIERLRNAILENADLLRESIMYEMGKTWEGTAEDLTSLTDSLRFYSTEIHQRKDVEIADREGTHTHKVISQPLGVAVAFLAYNFPLLNLGFKLGPALASGCSIIIKPSEFSPLSAYIIGEICAKINFPKGVVNVICGDLENVGIPLSESKIPSLITMIGSTETAQKLIGQSSKTSIKRYSMECGGNAPFIVFEDADISLAFTIGAALKTGNSGQICVAPNRFYVQEKVIERFTQGMVDIFTQTNVGFGRENSPQMGPLTNQKSLEKVENLVEKAVRQGGKLLYGGARIPGKGFYFQPTVIRLDYAEATVLQEEIFGPVAIIIPFKNKEEVLEYANSTEAGLASYVFSKDNSILHYFTEKLAFGEVHLNGVKFDIYLPHGGIKNSGIGVDCSSYALDDYLIKKRVTKALV